MTSGRQRTQKQGKPYDPSVDAIDDHLLSPPDYSEYAKTALFYDIKHVDAANPAGVNLSGGELLVIQGQKKNRKTTVALNLARNWCKQADRLRGGVILWETLESGQTPKKIKQQLICMEATAFMAEEMWGSVYNVPAKSSKGMDEYTNMDIVRDTKDPTIPRAPLFQLSVQFALSRDRTALQHRAIQEAIKRVNGWPLIIYGAPADQGKTKALETPDAGKPLDDCLPYKRWKKAVEKLNVKIIIVDHTNAYHGVNDYDRQQRGIVHVSAAVSELGALMVAVCQPSMGSTRNGGQMEARGGTRYAEEANTVFNTHYEQDSYRVKIVCGDARETPFPDIWVPMEKRSGLMFPSSYIAGRWA